MIDYGFADGIYVVAANDAEGRMAEAMARASMGTSVTTGVCAFVSARPIRKKCLALLDTSGREAIDPYSASIARRFGEQTLCGHDASASDHDTSNALAACGAVLLAQLAEHVKGISPDHIDELYCLRVKEGARSSKIYVKVIDDGL
jgi:hypothetical protein